MVRSKTALNDFLNYMKTQGESYCLTQKTSVYLPTCYGACLKEANRARAKLTKLIGGSTTFPAHGAWYNDAGTLIEEPVIVVELSHGTMCKKHVAKFVAIIDEYALATKQEAISIENGMSDFHIGTGGKHKPLFKARDSS